MRAMGLRRYGPPEVLEALEVGRPEPGPEDVLIRVAAAGVNPADCLLRSGGLRFVARQKMPFVPGADVAGVVEAVGAGVTRFGVGDPVYAMLPSTAGGYAEYAVATEGAVAPMPSGLTFGEAAGVPLAALTALQALRDEAALAAGARVLVNGASGGWGRSRSRSHGPWGRK
jgi:alcohol dehydrogenase